MASAVDTELDIEIKRRRSGGLHLLTENWSEFGRKGSTSDKTGALEKQQTCFQDRCLKPLGHPSVGASVAHSTASFKPSPTYDGREKKPRSEYRAGL
jgi:hypothetical protein